MRRRRDDSGQAAVQFAGMLPIVLLAILLCFKIYVTITTVEQVDNAARTGAREASKAHEPGICPGEAIKALPGWLTEATPGQKVPGDSIGRVNATVSGDSISGISCRVQAKVPVLWPAIPLDFTVDRTVHMPG